MMINFACCNWVNIKTITKRITIIYKNNIIMQMYKIIFIVNKYINKSNLIIIFKIWDRAIKI